MYKYVSIIIGDNMEKPYNLSFYNKKSIKIRMGYFHLKYPNSFSAEKCADLTDIIYSENVDYNTFMKESFENLMSEEKAKKYVDEIFVRFNKNNSTNVVAQVKEELNLEDVFEFTHENIEYIKINLNNGSHKIIENNTGLSSLELFNDLNNEMNKIKNEGTFSSEEIFERLIKRHKEIKLENELEIDKEKQSLEANIYLDIIKKEFPRAKIEAATEESMFIIKEGEEEKFVTIETKEGNYIIKNIDGTVYEKDGIVSEDINTSFEKIEVEKIELTEENFINIISENVATLYKQGLDEKQIFENIKDTYKINDSLDLIYLQDIILNQTEELFKEQNQKNNTNSAIKVLGTHPNFKSQNGA